MQVTGLSASLHVVSIQVRLAMCDTHSISIQVLGDKTALPALGTSLTVSDGNQQLLVAKVQRLSYNPATSTGTISCIDSTGWTSEYSPEIETNIDPSTTTNTLTLLRRMTNMNCNGDSVSCVGGGVQTLAPDRAVEGVTSAFGQLYNHSRSSTPGYTITNGGLNSILGNTSKCLSLDFSDDYSDHISKIYVQREAPQDSKSLITITNGGASSSANVRLKNPNAQYEEHDGLEYPIKFPEDYWIDPWTKQFCTITVPISTNTYHTAYECPEEGYKKVSCYQCNDKNGNWQLALYTSDPGTDLSHLLVNPIIRLSPGNSYSGGQTVRYMRIEHVTGGLIRCPSVGGVQIKAYVWTGEDYSITPWAGDYSSGDTGRVDYNVITSPYYGTKASFDAGGAGARIARQDSTTYNLGIVKPGLCLDHDTLEGMGTQVNGISYQTRCYDITFIEGSGTCETHLGGEH